ncbi:uncharacterized protein [Eurosta solidaginis]|uniref:uncharacterized protein n=1 Tax=Eurosta solidaginis TaxID=178769 RepID=UPI00353155A4
MSWSIAALQLGIMRLDVIDLDPYGCPNRFLDGAIQSLTSGGLLLVTATDMAVLAGNTPEACYAKCSSVPLRMKCCHEMGLRILLHCIETKATTPAKEPVSCQRFGLDLEEDLQTLLEARAAPRVVNMDQHESTVAVSGNAMNKIFEMEYDENKSNNTSDESFMALEKMCDKTASDPDSTLFKYIHSENKDMVIEDAKKRSADGNYFKTPCKQELQEIDEEAQSLQRLLHDLCVQEQHQLDNETPLKSIDVTLLEDIEAPSKMWDSTIVGDTTLQTLPLKMVRLLRPSTILEENCEDQSNSSLGGDDVSSHISFQSAQKGSETSATTSCYETAHDTTGASAPRKVSHYTQSESSEESHELEKSIILSRILASLSCTITKAMLRPCQAKLSSSGSFDDSLEVIELSDDKSHETGGNLNKSVFIKEEKEQQKKEIAIEPIARNAESMLSNYHNKSSIDFEESFENDKENRSLFNESTEKSLHVNDTMEEVEYMTKKGMQYMQAAEPTTNLGNLSPTVNETQMAVKPLQEREKTFTYSPKKAKSNCGSPAKKFINGKPTAVVTGTKGMQARVFIFIIICWNNPKDLVKSYHISLEMLML